jgi:hypothetical protein
MTPIEIKKLFYDKYVDKHGLGLLEPDLKNDNGVLFLAYFLILCHKAGIFTEYDAISFLIAHDKIKVRDGEYKRRPDDNRTDAHDNMVGVVIGLLLADKRSEIEKICDHMDKTGNVSDHTTGSVWKLSQMRQGTDIAFYKICAGRIPSILDMIWLCGGIIVGTFFSNASSKNLGWARTFGMRHAGLDHLPMPYLVMLSLAFLISDLNMLIRYKSQSYFFERYFKEGHPIRLLQRYLDAHNKGGH